MTADLFATIYMLAFAACGILIARPIFRRDDPLRRLFFGLVTGLVLLIWLPTLLPALYAFIVLVLGVDVFIATGLDRTELPRSASQQPALRRQRSSAFFSAGAGISGARHGPGNGL